MQRCCENRLHSLQKQAADCSENTAKKEKSFRLKITNIRLLEWWNGRHEGLKIPWPSRLCGFESRFEYQRLALALQELFLLPHSGHRLNTNNAENLNFIKNSLLFIVFLYLYMVFLSEQLEDCTQPAFIKKYKASIVQLTTKGV